MNFKDCYPTFLLENDNAHLQEVQIKPFDYEVGDFVWYFHHSFDKPKKLMVVDLNPIVKTLTIISGDRKFTVNCIHIHKSEEACQVKHFDNEYIKNKFIELTKVVARTRRQRNYGNLSKAF